MSEFEDRVVMVSGADGGIGAEVAAQFAAAGAHVYLTGIRPAEGSAIAARVGPRARYLELDVSDEAHWQRAMAEVLARHARLDVLVNNAGYLKPGLTLEDTSLPDWRRHFAINTDGVFLGCKHAILRFKAQGDPGVIVNTGSVAGMVGFGSVVYGATKGAVNQITKGLAIECASFDIRVNAICPGAMPLTNFTLFSPDEAFAPRDEGYLESVATLQPLGRYVTAEDCAAAALFLASDDARNITGVLLPVDGGYVAK
jgi:NAD(P)-dependent dehydrogenase (short-subunit alcohol dehydrogenase family)